MKTSCTRLRWGLAMTWVALLMFIPLDPRASRGEDRGQERDWQAWANSADWTFEVAEAHPLFCAIERNGKFGAYEIGIRVQKGGAAVCIDVIEDEVVKHSWMGHQSSVFGIRNERLYYVDFHRSTTGASVVAVNLDTGQLLWREGCRGLGVGGHWGYRNLTNLSVSDEVVVVRGRESLGRCIEVKRAADGQTVGHRCFGEDE